MPSLPNNQIGLLDGLQSATGGLLADLSTADQLITGYARALMVGVAGDVKVTFIDGTSVVLPALNPGTIYAVNITKIWKVGTTATSIVALY